MPEKNVPSHTGLLPIFKALKQALRSHSNGLCNAEEGLLSKREGIFFDRNRLNPDYADTITATAPVATLAKQIFQKKAGTHAEGIPVPIFDPLATMIMAGGLTNYQSHSLYLEVNTTDTETDNHCGQTDVVESGSKKIEVVQGVSQQAFATNFATVING